MDRSPGTRAFLLALGMALAGAAWAPLASATSLGQERLTSMRDSASGTVTSVDAAARMLTVRGPRGEAAYRVDAKVQGLEAIKAGDAVRVEYVAGVGLKLLRGGNDGDAPADPKAAKGTTIVTRVIAVDRARQTVKLKGPQGHVTDYQLADKADLVGIKVGDQMVAKIYELVAVDVVPAKR